jgi:hypothetical protein
MSNGGNVKSQRVDGDVIDDLVPSQSGLGFAFALNAPDRQARSLTFSQQSSVLRLTKVSLRHLKV